MPVRRQQARHVSRRAALQVTRTLRRQPLPFLPAGAKLKARVQATVQMRELMRQRQPDAFPILLTHHPHAFDAAVKAALPLTLAGHTHGGQWMFDRQHGLGPALFRYWSGLYTRGHSQMIISNGVGNWLPLRINAPAEIVHLTLRCAGDRSS